MRTLNAEHLQFFELKKSSKFLKETDKRVYTTDNVKLTIQSAEIL